MTMTSTLPITTEFTQFKRLPVINGWSNFIRSDELGSGANHVFNCVQPGSFLEIKDNKFLSDSLILLRRTDFERLVKYSNTSMAVSSRVKKIFISITKTTQSYSHADHDSAASHLIESVQLQASLGLELTSTPPVYDSIEKYFASDAGDIDEIADNLPTSRTDLKRGTRKR